MNLVITITSGKEYKKIAELTHPTIKKYAERINADFIVLDEDVELPHWEKLKLFNYFKTYDRILFLDTDLIIRDDCPNLFDVVPEDYVGMFEEGKFSPRGGYITRAVEEYGFNLPEWDGKYYNTGVMLVPKCYRSLFHQKPEQHIINNKTFLGEQTYLNLIIQKESIQVYDLVYRFNRMTIMDSLTGEPRHASYIIHYAGCPNTKLMMDHIRSDLEKWEKDSPEYNYKRNIVVSVGGGLGDQVCAEPVIRYIKEKIYPNENIYVLSHWPSLFRHLTMESYLWDYSFKHDDDHGPYYVCETLRDPSDPLWRYVSATLSHPVDFGSISACGRLLPDEFKQIKLAASVEGFREVVDIVGLDTYQDLILVHPGKGWESKTFPVEWWQDLTDVLVEKGLKVGIIGKRVNETQGYVPIKCPEGAIDFRDILSVEGLIALMATGKVLISNDSAPIHIAGAFDNWIVLIPTCKHPDHVLPYRNGSKSYKTLALYKELTLNKIDSSPTMYVTGGQTLDYVNGDISDYLPDTSTVVEAVLDIVDNGGVKS